MDAPCFNDIYLIYQCILKYRAAVSILHQLASVKHTTLSPYKPSPPFLLANPAQLYQYDSLIISLNVSFTENEQALFINYFVIKPNKGGKCHFAQFLFAKVKDRMRKLIKNIGPLVCSPSIFVSPYLVSHRINNNRSFVSLGEFLNDCWHCTLTREKREEKGK